MSWNHRRYMKGYNDCGLVIVEDGIERARTQYVTLSGSAAVDEYETGFRARLEEDGVNPDDDITEVKANRLVDACNALGLNAVVHWDRSPWCCRVSLEGSAPIDDSTASIYFMLEDSDSYKICDGKGWQWKSQIGLHRENYDELQDVSIDILERTWLGDTERDTAATIATLVSMIDVREIVSA